MIKYLVVAALITAPYAIPSPLPALSENESEYYREHALDLVQQYYQQLNVLTGDTTMSYQKKDELENDLVATYFTSPSIIVFNDVPDPNGIQDMRVKEYLHQLNLLYGDPQTGITFSKPKITVYGIFDDEDSFFMDVSVERTIRCYGKPEYANVKKLDYYMGFAPYSRDIKIYSITEHQEKQNTFVKATIQSNPVAPPANTPATGTDATAESTTGTVIFNVTPANAQVKVDGQVTYYVNGMGISLPKGRHVIEISAPHCYRYIYTQYDVNGGEVSSINRDLVLKTSTLKLIAANNKAYGGDVYIDGDSVGRMPVNYVSLVEGLHSVQVFKDGYFAWKKNVRIEEGHDFEQQVNLVNIENTEDALRIISGVLYPRVAYASSPVNPAYVPVNNAPPANNYIQKSTPATPVINNTAKTVVQPASPKVGSSQNQPAIVKPKADDQFYSPTNSGNSQTTKQPAPPAKSRKAAKNSDEGWTPVVPDFSGKGQSQQARPQNNGQTPTQKSGSQGTQTYTNTQNATGNQTKGYVNTNNNPSQKTVKQAKAVTPAPVQQRGNVTPPPPPKKSGNGW